MNQFEFCRVYGQADFIAALQELKDEMEKALQEIYLAGDKESLFKSGISAVEEFVVRAEKLVVQAMQILIDQQEHNR